MIAKSTREVSRLSRKGFAINLRVRAGQRFVASDRGEQPGASLETSVVSHTTPAQIFTDL
jgi:hypothetical protein